MELTKEKARELEKGDYIPKDTMGKVNIEELSFRKTLQSEVYQCDCITGHDPQSGPFYCGKIAEFIAFVEKDGQLCVVVTCDRPTHRPSKEQIFSSFQVDDLFSSMPETEVRFWNEFLNEAQILFTLLSPDEPWTNLTLPESLREKYKQAIEEFNGGQYWEVKELERMFDFSEKG